MSDFPFRLGAIPSPDDPRDWPATINLDPVPAALPSAFRLSKLPPVFTQLRGSCVAAGLSGIAMKNEIDEAGTAALVDFETWYDILAIEQFGSQSDTGLYPRASLDSMRNAGPPLASGGGTREHLRISSYYAVPDLPTARRIVYEQRQPVALVSKIAMSWSETTPVGQLLPIDYYGPDNPDVWVGTHLWWMWGWDDRPTLGNLIRNSWGYEFGKNGNCYMTNMQWQASFIEAWWVDSSR